MKTWLPGMWNACHVLCTEDGKLSQASSASASSDPSESSMSLSSESLPWVNHWHPNKWDKLLYDLKWHYAKMKKHPHDSRYSRHFRAGSDRLDLDIVFECIANTKALLPMQPGVASRPYARCTCRHTKLPARPNHIFIPPKVLGILCIKFFAYILPSQLWPLLSNTHLVHFPRLPWAKNLSKTEVIIEGVFLHGVNHANGTTTSQRGHFWLQLSYLSLSLSLSPLSCSFELLGFCECGKWTAIVLNIFPQSRNPLGSSSLCFTTTS